MNNYIDISKQQRVVFVDNIKYEDAKSLSESYPFAIIMTDTEKNQDYTADGGHHTIWRGGKCYSYISAVDNTPITINTYSISLNISPTGKLSLNVGSAITNYELSRCLNNGDTIIGYTENLDNSYENTDNNSQYTEVINAKNTGELYFKLYGINNETLNEYNENGLDLFDFRLFRKNDENNNILSTYISNLQSQYASGFNDGIKYVFNIEQEYIVNDLILEVSYKFLGKTKIKRYPIKLSKTPANQFYWVGSGDPHSTDQIPDNNEITNAYLSENTNWHALGNDPEDCNANPIPVNEGNIYVIIPANKQLRVAMMEDGSTSYIVDEGIKGYSYEIVENITINNSQYKLLKLYNEQIKEFTNIIQ